MDDDRCVATRRTHARSSKKHRVNSALALSCFCDRENQALSETYWDSK